ncbi:phosphatidate phosphatase LPIN3 [Asbolus verrucosus]|uniref:phosphatidate phosphatase n=1 Tax=Asbolus verrucosus TaxID=1661398 RepID=A0A482VWJ8_ASBVE|nr:phosphatidate phosphatase LPIN3 [Asbolus verrucosus]
MHSMNYIGRFFSNFKEFYNEINTATLTGAIDVIVVEQEDGTYNCSPFHVRFGKLGVLRSREKVVDIEINGEPQDIHMKLGESGEAFFVEEIEDDENEIPEHLATSPIPVSEFENIFSSQGRRRSFDAATFENQVNDYTKRRNTADNDTASVKNRERDFLKRQIGLGNIGIGENSAAEEVTRSVQSKESAEDLSKDVDISDTIFKMDSLEMDTSRSECATKAEEIREEPGQVKDDPGSESRSSKKKRRKMKKKNAPRKSSSVNQIAANVEQAADKNDSATTDPSSIESNSSEPELKELQAHDGVQSGNSRKIIDPDFHFFSDTELTTNVVDSRADSPVQIEAVQSDSEFEVKNRKGEAKDNGQSWEWGGFPNVSQNNSPTSEQANAKTDQFAISNVFSFMKKSHGQSEGIYLSDITSVDPEVAALYFTKGKNKTSADADMDCESGNGPSLAQSPNSAEGCKSIDSDFDEHIKGGRMYANEVSMSLCGWDPEPDAARFEEHTVAFSDFCNNPTLLEDPNLVVNIRGKFYNWKVAAPIISSVMVFNRPLLQSTIDQLCSLHMPSAQGKDAKPESRSWWNWRRSKTSRETTPVVDSAATAKTVIEAKDTAIDMGEDQILATEISVVQQIPHLSQMSEEKECAITISPKNCQLSEKCKKTLRLSSKQIVSLNLRDGMNEIVFSVTTAYQGTTRCTCHLYKWKWDDKIVISDIDGTITKSDVLGHILPIVGKDWAQSGVAQLFNKIKDNGYKLLYLSARAIGQARITREYLRSIKQGNLTMPDGPILLNPTSLITAFHREVIEKKPEQFKISCMSDIKALFPPDSNPFYAGYGNRINDVWAYRAVGIPIVRIFTINPKGELKHELTQTFQSTYTGQSLVVNDVFPPLLHKYSNMTYYVDQLFPPLIEAANDYSQFAYWRDPLPVVEELPEVA